MNLGKAILAGNAKLPLPAGAKSSGKDLTWVWASIPWDQLAALPGTAISGWTLAYLDENEFLAATVGFTPAMIREVMEKKAAYPSQCLSDFGDELGMAAGKLAAWGRDLGEAWDRNGAACFSLFQEVYFTGRFSYGTHEDIVLLIQWRVALAAWERELAAHPACPPFWVRVVAGLDSPPVLKDLADAAAHLGQPAFSLAPPVDQSLRVAFTSGSPVTEDRIARNELIAETWQQKFLMALTVREIADLQFFGAVTVYLDTDAYLRSARTLTADQRSREINHRIASGLSPAEYLDSIQRLRLIFLAELRGHIDGRSDERSDGHSAEQTASRPSDAGDLAGLEAVFQAEISALDALLRLVWGVPKGAGHKLRAQDLLLQSRILSAFAAQAGEAGLVDALSLFEKTLPNLEPV